jgi:poly(U)-specific endoribonuclease
MFDNYRSRTGESEELTDDELREEHRFIDACMNTAVMQEAHQFLIGEGKVSEDIDDFKQQLFEIWFEFYSRSADENVKDSSAFEHVFIGEAREGGKKTALGCHNWLDYYHLEKEGVIDYTGYHPAKTIVTNDSIDCLYDSKITVFEFSIKMSRQTILAFWP